MRAFFHSIAVPTLVLAAACLAAGAARADTPPPQGVISLQATASTEVTQDLLSVRFSTTREGQDAATVQSQLKQALDAALAEAKKVAKPGDVDVRTGNFALYPRYAPKGGITGWQGSAELIVEGKDMAAIGALTGRIKTLNIAGTGYGLSRELREKLESDVTAQAIARYRAKAADYAKLFGYGSYVIREVNVGASEPGSPPMPMMRAKAMSMASADESLPVEAGKATITVNVNGTVQLGK